MSCPTFRSDLSEAEVARILLAPEVRRPLGDRLDPEMRVTLLDEGTFQATGPEGVFIVRFPGGEADYLMLKREETVQGGFRDRVTLLLPDTTVIDNLDGCPAFAIHRMIPGQPLTSDLHARLSPEAHDRLVGDLANFFYEAHSIPLGVALEWLGIPFDGERTVAELASTRGKPSWFAPDTVAEMRPRLRSLLDDDQAALFEDTVRCFEALGTKPDYMVFGHGDMHGYNMALAEDHLGPRLVGAFDLGCVGILDVHEDFFRLSLVSEDLLERVIEAYLGIPGQTRSIKRDRIAIYYRAFLFYLMVGESGESLDHLKRLLKRHVERYTRSRQTMI
jgi:hypothetical protein